MFRFVYKLIAGLFFKLYLKKVQGLKNLPEPPFILAFEHHSFIDPPLLISILPARMLKQIKFLAEKGLFSLKGRNFFVSFFAKRFALPTNGGVDRAVAAFKVFPKLVLLVSPLVYSLKRKKPKTGTGVAVIAKESKIPVVPVIISGTDKIWPIGGRLRGVRKFKSIKINIGKPIMPDRKISKEAFTKKILQAMRNLVCDE